MNDKDNLHRVFMLVLNEKVKSEFLILLKDNYNVTKSIIAEPYGRLSTETLDIIKTALTPLILQQLKHNINEWINEEFSSCNCLWDKSHACLQKKDSSINYHSSSDKVKNLFLYIKEEHLR
ncbi:hypothetical protein EZQ80_004747 [Escherichia coli]|nr:hypothetical protein [Escherichia coli]EIG8944696.1 hypothetical protein [Escherichia coli]EKM3058028.1 hypothetical protein [Escherichia coli]EKY6446318.1 hypothetical protein [Escherichia coli]TJQ39764.1 hypothetical protein C9Z62_26085 [Escherichia coli]